MPRIVMYTSAYCSYCVRARMLLKSKGAEFTEVRVDEHPERRPEMEARSGGRVTVPQIFVDDFHVGGYDDMTALNARGYLDALLQGGSPAAENV